MPLSAACLAIIQAAKPQARSFVAEKPSAGLRPTRSRTGFRLVQVAYYKNYMHLWGNFASNATYPDNIRGVSLIGP